MDGLVSQLEAALREKFGVTALGGSITELDSSTENKFSRHLHIQTIPAVLFRDSLQLGSFLREVWMREENSVARQAGADWNSVCVVNFSVYRRNQNMRLPYSSKLHKKTTLVPTGRFCHERTLPEDVMERCVICPADLQGVQLLFWKRGEPIQPQPKQTTTGPGKVKSATEGPKVGSERPKLDAYVAVVLSALQPPGCVSSVRRYEGTQTVIYNVGGNKFCGRLGQEHRQNHVMYVVDLRRHIMYQKCHDGECQGYRGDLEYANSRRCFCHR